MSIEKLLDLRNATDLQFEGVTGIYPDNTPMSAECNSPFNCISDCNGNCN
ncbi:hypothetical protein LJC04_05630 [Ruminococcaceae bacterium OttesenSCG-928-O06]|nr:hypothetical protein [Ruminococcaceae bacterium OttesenSCG-928-O06]